MSKYFVSILLGIIGAWAIGKFASPLGFVDRPNERSSHKHPTPKGGGIGIFLVLLFISIIENINALFWLPVTIMAGVAFIGDRIYIGPIIRIVEQTALAGIMVIGKEASFERGFIGLIIIILMIVYIV